MNNEYILKHRSKWLIDTNHAIKRFEERGVEGLRDQFVKMIDRLTTLKNFAHTPYNTEWFVWFRALGQGMIVSYRRDTKTDSRKNHFFIVTVMPKGTMVDQKRHKRITIK